MSVTEPSKILTPWATSGLKNNIPQTANPVTGNAGYDQGFPAINMTAKEAGGIPPFGQDFNGILFSITESLRYMQAGGLPSFSAELSTAIGGYPKGATVIGADGLTLWQNQVDGNTNDPNTTPTNWVASVSGSYPVGAPIPWQSAVPPAGFLAMTGQSFSAMTYPRLALAYPSLLLPDMRAEFIRGWDNGRGVDSGRALLSTQAGAIETHNHLLPTGSASLDPSSGSWGVSDQYWIEVDGINTMPAQGEYAVTGSSGYAAYSGAIAGNFAAETRPRNISFNYIVRAA